RLESAPFSVASAVNSAVSFTSVLVSWRSFGARSAATSWVTSEWMSRPEPRPGEEMVAMVASISGSGIHECARLRIRETQHLQGDFARDAAHDVALAITHDDDR